MIISIRSVGLVVDTVVCVTLAKWETLSGQFGGYLRGSDQLLGVGEGVSHPSSIARTLIFWTGLSYCPAATAVFNRPNDLAAG